jgi:hypothetical protein
MTNLQGVKDPIEHRFKIAIKVLTWSSIGLATLAVIMVLAAAIVSVAVKKSELFQETARYVFTALLPLLGTWVGTILAFYFSTENFQTASESVRKTIKDIQKERLETHLAGDTMLSYDKIKGVEIDDSQKATALKIKLEANFQNILSRQYTRIPIFNKKRIALYMLHGSILFEFFSEIQSDDPVTIVKKDATLEDILNYRNEKYKKLITETFAIVGKNQTLAYAKSLMDRISKETGETCQDVFVTETGNKNEAVLGWLTDKRIERYSYLEG